MSLGLDDDAFWRKTPRQIVLVLEAKALQFRREQNARAWLAYHVAVLQRSKKIPPIRKLMVREERRPQTWQQMKGVAQQWAALLGKVKHERN